MHTKIIFALIILTVLSACSSSTGWQVGFGVYPVTQLHNIQSLQGNQKTTIDTERRVAKGDKNDY